ncbi:ribonucleoside-diphosphate reductase subunit alpha [Rossellomorea sp. BNER]|uniref:ribonucleoside-diphosphate reductase subunit alpha n=1 Tax=Rossellomorea sp. BNER TaxID=2962031 RepID=UPI003AF20E49|nr:ribonucleoside-diphosphate reductase subunit alpha [Rossellomorea sp. BNER]
MLTRTADPSLILNKIKNHFVELPIEELVIRSEMILDQNPSITLDDWTEECILHSLSLLNEDSPRWTFVAAELYLSKLYREVANNRGESSQTSYFSFHNLIETLTQKGIYNPTILENFSIEEINELGKEMNAERDSLFTYIGVKTLADRYLARDHSGLLFELPQERWMIISMTLMQKENKDTRLQLIKEAYWALSNLFMTVATPTLSNAGKSYGQLSSCFIDTVDDSLQGIFDSNTDIANLSKNGGGIGVYLGKIRSHGSTIKGFKSASSGVIPWMKQLNNTAVSVDQLGQRKGAICTYLDIWHRDILSFLDVKLNNGDERLRTHDLFTGVCLPDLFMEAVEERKDWYLFDPHEVREVMGFSLEDYYDESKGNGSFREKYQQCIYTPSLSKRKLPAIEIMKRIMKSQLETGTPFMFYRDEVNRKNANSHIGMVYSSNLCTEITQNQSVTTVIEQKVDDGEIIIRKSPGDFVVCNLSSINLARAVTEEVLERLISIQVRMLDNVIDINSIPVLQANLTNQKYRGIGLGTFGWHHLLALKKIKWESNEAIQYADRLYEKIAFLTIKASMSLSKEKGSAPAFKGSDWETGEYFVKRGYYQSPASPFPWARLIDDVREKGMRNTYLMAVAPNSTTSIIAGSTPSIDPVFKKFYSEEKKNYKIPVTAPDLNCETTWFYKTAYRLDQHWSIDQNSARQKHIDQSLSFNLYVDNTIKAIDLLNLHLHAWKSGLKTTYYLRSTSTSTFEECESCSS